MMKMLCSDIDRIIEGEFRFQFQMPDSGCVDVVPYVTLENMRFGKGQVLPFEPFYAIAVRFRKPMRESEGERCNVGIPIEWCEDVGMEREEFINRVRERVTISLLGLKDHLKSVRERMSFTADDWQYIPEHGDSYCCLCTDESRVPGVGDQVYIDGVLHTVKGVEFAATKPPRYIINGHISILVSLG